MEQHQKTVLALIRSAMFNEPLDASPDTDWPEVLKELHTHGIAYLVNSTLPELPGMDEGFSQAWSYRTISNIQRFYHVLEEQSNLLALLTQHGIPAVILKGAAAAMYYPNPDGRMMGDIDLLVAEGTDQAALTLLLENGCSFSKPQGRCRRHENLRRNHVEIELHRSFATLSDEMASRHLDALLQSALSRTETCEIQSFSFPALPPLENGLVLLEHLNQHMSEGIGLRHVLDWVMYVHHVLDDAFWRSAFRAEVRRIGLETFAITATRMAQLYLGLPEEGHTWCLSAEPEACADLLEYVLASGNFGLKRGESRAVTRVWSDFENPLDFFRKLQSDGCRNFHEQIRRFPFLKPFAWLMRIFRLIGLSFQRRISLGKIRDSFGESRERIDLFHRIGIREAHDDDE